MPGSPLDRMSVLLDEWHACGDPRRLFLDCYRRMTSSMVPAIDDGEFDDGEWVATLLDRFADYSFVALGQWERDDPAVPSPWRLAHDTARAGTAHPLQHLLLGVNAHIAYDLPLVVVDLLDDEWEVGGEALRIRRLLLGESSARTGGDQSVVDLPARRAE